MADLLTKRYKEERLLLFQDMAIWEDAYRDRHCAGKTEKELLALGWRKDINGLWCSEMMRKALDRKFGKRLQALGHLKLFLISNDLRLIPDEVIATQTSSD